MNLESLKYPIGKFQFDSNVTKDKIGEWITTIETFPKEINKIIELLPGDKLNWRYRPEGWSIKQVIHHLADSHSNAFIRIKLALTESNPTIKPYDETLWSVLYDSTSNHITPSLKIIDGVHEKWSLLLKNLSDQEWDRTYFHPEHEKSFSIKEAIEMYNWHCKHHLAHIQQALENDGQFGNTQLIF